MAIGINGSMDWGFVPLNWTDSDLAGSFYWNRGNHLKSANDPLRYQIVWTRSGLNEGVEPSAANYTGGDLGDVAYVKFTIQDYNQDSGIWETLATVTKTRDIVNKKYDTGEAAPNHRFTIDISQIASDQLSYSLCPIGKGTWKSSIYGGMNGGAIMQDNVISNSANLAGQPVSNYNVSRNGTFRFIRVLSRAWVINLEGEIIETSYSNNTTSFTSPSITVINSVNQFTEDSVWYTQNSDMTSAFESNNGNFLMTNYADGTSFKFLSRYNNYSFTTTVPEKKKDVRTDEYAECLNFYIRRVTSVDIGGTAGEDDVRAIGMYVETFKADGTAENDFYIRDFEDNLIVDDSGNYFKEYQELMFTQNISVGYITSASTSKYDYDNTVASGTVTAHAWWTPYSLSTITTDTSYYRVSLTRFSYDTVAATPRRTSEYRYYQIDRDDENLPYGFVRFHWLNDIGSIDSYTAKRDVTEGYSIDKGIIERNSTDRTWVQSGQKRTGSTGNWSTSNLTIDDFHSDTMRGGDIYKGGREVMSINAERNFSVYTEPLNIRDAKWLSKMMLSPNVWVEMFNPMALNSGTAYLLLRPLPTSLEYMPVIITNSDAETVNQEKGLVKFNIEYTLSHKVITQNN